MTPSWTMVVYNRQGALWERHSGTPDDLRSLGVDITTLRGQLAWTCYLLRNGGRVAMCKRGVWKDVPGLEAKP